MISIKSTHLHIKYNYYYSLSISILPVVEGSLLLLSLPCVSSRVLGISRSWGGACQGTAGNADIRNWSNSSQLKY